MQKRTENQKLRKLSMAAVALLMTVCLGTGIFLQYGDLLFSGSSDGDTESLIPDEFFLEESRTVISQPEEELLARPQGGKNAYEILEILPDTSYSAFRYMIGGMEPNKDVLIAMANMSGYSNIMGGPNANTPFTIIENGIRKEYLDSYNGTVGNKQNNQYEIKRIKVGTAGADNSSTQSPGYFQYVGNGIGTYIIDPNKLVKEIMPMAGGQYAANFLMAGDYYEFYNASRAGNTVSPDTQSTTGMNYDAYPQFRDSAGDASGIEGYYVVSAAADKTNGTYVIDEDMTRTVLGLEDATDEEYARVLLEEQHKDDNESKIVYKRYEENSVSGGDAAENLPRWNLTFAYGNAQIVYGITEYTYNPGNGEFFAKLEKVGGSYYHEIATGETGEYERFVTGFEVTTQEGESAWQRDWVWREGASPDGKIYSTVDEYNDGKGVLWTPNFVGIEKLEDGEKVLYKTYYCKNSYRNNEWFKLICLTTGYNYDMSKTPAENLALAEPYLKAFDKSTRINITTVRPEEVTQEMIDKAEVIYIANNYPFENLGAALRAAGVSSAADFTTDFSQFTLTKSIFKECMNKSKAVMINVNVGTLSNTWNMTKLYQMFTMYKNPHNMEYFLDNMKGYKDGFNCIDDSGNVVVRTTAQNGKNVYYSLDSEIAFQNSLAGKTPAEIAAAKASRYYTRAPYGSSATFVDTYFQVLQGGYVGNDIPQPGFELGWDNNTWVDAVANGERYLIFHWYGEGFMQNIANMPKIHEILKQDTFGIYVTNAVMNSSWEDVIYVDEFDEQYKIYYMIESTSVLYAEPVVEKVEVYLDSNGDGTIDDGSSPFLEIRANNTIPANPSAGQSIVDGNGTALRYRENEQFYPGYAVNVKDQMAGAQERCFIIKATGKKNIGTKEEPKYVEVVDSTAVSVIVRDMFELN